VVGPTDPEARIVLELGIGVTYRVPPEPALWATPGYQRVDVVVETTATSSS